MAITEADRLQRQKNAAAYKALSDSQKKASIQGVTGYKPPPVEQPRITRQDGENGTYQIMGKLTPEELAKFQATNAVGQMAIAENAYNTQQGGTVTNSAANNTGGQGNAQSYIDQLNNARRNQVMADLGKSRDNALMNLQGERAQVQPRYYDARNTTAAGSQQQARNFAEYMASRGGASSGAGAQGELMRQGTLQGNIGSLNRQEGMALDDLGRRETGVKNAYESDLQSANAGLEGDRMQALLNQYNQDKQFDLQLGGLMGQYQGNQTAQASQFNQQFGLQQQNQQFNQNLQTQQLERSNFESDRQYEFATGQQQWENAFQQGQFDFNKGQAAFENAFKNKSFQQSVNEAASSRGLQWASLNQRDKEFIAQEAWNKEQFKYTKEQDTIQNNLAANKPVDYKYETDPVFIGGIADAGRGGLTSAQIANDAENIIADITYSGYQKLLSAAKVYESSRNILR